MPDQKIPEREETTSAERCTCGFCGLEFPTVQSLYRHQQKEHDPDNIMFSELGLPK